jgi:hypothetical protein
MSSAYLVGLLLAVSANALILIDSDSPLYKALARALSIPDVDTMLIALPLVALLIFISSYLLVRGVGANLFCCVIAILIPIASAALLSITAKSKLRHMDVFGIDPLLLVSFWLWLGAAAMQGVILTVAVVRRSRYKRFRLICQRCGYCLKGLTEARCPECGMPFDPRLLGKL